MKRYVGSFRGANISDDSTKDQLLDVIEYLFEEKEVDHEERLRLIDAAYKPNPSVAEHGNAGLNSPLPSGANTFFVGWCAACIMMAFYVIIFL